MKIIIILLLSIIPIKIEYQQIPPENIVLPINKNLHKSIIVDAYCYIPEDSAITADGTEITTQKRWIAISRDLLQDFPFGSVVSVTKMNIYSGHWIVKDLMAERHIKSIDFMIVDTIKYPIKSWKNIKIKRILDKT